jgi:hypothetical protein
MELTISSLATAFLNLPVSRWVELLPRELPLTDAERTHSVSNVRQWRSYLPAECVNSMVAMGWDLST